MKKKYQCKNCKGEGEDIVVKRSLYDEEGVDGTECELCGVVETGDIEDNFEVAFDNG